MLAWLLLLHKLCPARFINLNSRKSPPLPPRSASQKVYMFRPTHYILHGFQLATSHLFAGDQSGEEMDVVPARMAFGMAYKLRNKGFSVRRY